MPRPIITITTDFGQKDSYVAQLKGVLLSINPLLHLVDLTHAIHPQDVARAAAVLDETIDLFPENTLHIVVVDPGVGTARRIVGVEMASQRFVAPDNGVLSMVSNRFKPKRIVRLTVQSFWRQRVSNTFHGRDVMAPVAAHWSLGTDLADFGEPYTEALVELPSRRPTQITGGVAGEVIREDSFGNLITNIDESLIPDESRKRLTVQIGPHSIQGIRRCYGERQPDELLTVIGSSGQLEIAVNRGSAAELLSLSTGAEVQVLGIETTDNE